MANIEQRIENLISDKVNKLGYELYDVEYVKEGKEYYLRIYIDQSSGIDIEDCEKVSREIDEIIDTADFIDTQYFLEVSSPGVERKLTREKHLQDNIGNNIEVKMFSPINGKKHLQGILKSFNTNTISVEAEEEIEIERKNISVINTIFDWKGI